jgi:hypothetical protein
MFSLQITTVFGARFYDVDIAKTLDVRKAIGGSIDLSIVPETGMSLFPRRSFHMSKSNIN